MGLTTTIRRRRIRRKAATPEPARTPTLRAAVLTCWRPYAVGYVAYQVVTDYGSVFDVVLPKKERNLWFGPGDLVELVDPQRGGPTSCWPAAVLETPYRVDVNAVLANLSRETTQVSVREAAAGLERRFQGPCPSTTHTSSSPTSARSTCSPSEARSRDPWVEGAANA